MGLGQHVIVLFFESKAQNVNGGTHIGSCWGESQLATSHDQNALGFGSPNLSQQPSAIVRGTYVILLKRFRSVEIHERPETTTPRQSITESASGLGTLNALLRILYQKTHCGGYAWAPPMAWYPNMECESIDSWID